MRCDICDQKLPYNCDCSPELRKAHKEAQDIGDLYSKTMHSRAEQRIKIKELKMENRILKQKLKIARELIVEHHNASRLPQLGEGCVVCTVGGVPTDKYNEVMEDESN